MGRRQLRDETRNAGHDRYQKRDIDQERQIAFRIGPGLVDHLIAQGGWQVSLGARPMRQTIQRLVESPLADEILAGRVRTGERLLACAGPAGVEFRREG